MSAEPQSLSGRHDPSDVFSRHGDETFDLDSFMMSGKTVNRNDTSMIGASGPSSRSGVLKEHTNRNTSNAPDTSNATHAMTDGSDQPVWSDLKTKAGKDRKRLPLACIACRRKKIRCSGEKPACKHCLKSRIPCVYKVTTRKAAPRTDYMAMLDKRLKRMEDRVMKVIPKEDLQKLPDIVRAVVKPAPASQQSKSAKKRSADEAFLERWTDPKHNQARDRSPRVVQPSLPNLQEEPNLLVEGAEFLPSKDVQLHLVEVYFDFVYGQSYHLLHKPSFMRKVEAGTVPPMLMLAVCAVSARFATHPQVRDDPPFRRGQTWAKAAMNIAVKRYSSPNINTLTVFLLLGLHTLGTCEGGSSWMLGGMAFRMAIALRLHEDFGRDPGGPGHEHPDEFSFTDREIRRRTMWSAFIMEQMMGSGYERPACANESDMRIQLPIKEHLFQMEIPGVTEHLHATTPRTAPTGAGQLSDPRSNMGVAAYIVRVVALFGRLIHYVNRGGKEKDEHQMWSPLSKYRTFSKELEDMKDSLPEHLRYNKDNLQNHAADRIANQFIYMHVIFAHCKLVLNNFSLPETNKIPLSKDMPLQFQQEGRDLALEAATTTARLIKEGLIHRLVVPFAAYCAYSASVVHVHYTHSRNPQLAKVSRDCLEDTTGYIYKMKRYWGNFSYMLENLKEMFQERQQSVAKGVSTPNARPGQNSALQYGDWYDRYPQGQNDYEEPEAGVKREPGDDAVLSEGPNLLSVDEYLVSNSSGTGAKFGGRKRGRRPPTRPPATTRNPPTDTGHLQPPTDHARPPHNLDGMTMPRSPFGIPESYDRSQIHPQQVPLQPQSQNHNAHLHVPSLSSLDSFSFYPMQQPGIIDQLDRQAVLASYSAMDHTPAQLQQHPPHPGNNMWDMNMGGAGGGAFGDEFMMNEPSGAWLTPFNLDPAMEYGSDFGMGVFGGPQEFWWQPPSERHGSLDGNINGGNGGGNG